MKVAIVWYYSGNQFTIPAMSAYSVRQKSKIEADFILITDNPELKDYSTALFNKIIIDDKPIEDWVDTRGFRPQGINPYLFARRWVHIFKVDYDVIIALDTDILCVRPLNTLLSEFMDSGKALSLDDYPNGGLVLINKTKSKTLPTKIINIFNNVDNYFDIINSNQGLRGDNDERIFDYISKAYPNEYHTLSRHYQWIPCIPSTHDYSDYCFIHYCDKKPWVFKEATGTNDPIVFLWHKIYKNFCRDFNIYYPKYDASYLTGIDLARRERAQSAIPVKYFPDPIIWDKYDYRTYNTGLDPSDDLAVRTRTVVDMHLGILKDALDNGFNSIIVFEDNLKALPNWEYKLHLFHRDAPLDADLLYYGYHINWNKNVDTISTNIIRPLHPAGNFAFGIMNRSAMRTMYETGRRCKELLKYKYKPMDYIIPVELLSTKKLKAYAPKMKIFGQFEHTSMWEGIIIPENQNTYNIDEVK